MAFLRSYPVHLLVGGRVLKVDGHIWVETQSDSGVRFVCFGCDSVTRCNYSIPTGKVDFDGIRSATCEQIVVAKILLD